jgi:hypothetical protein
LNSRGIQLRLAPPHPSGRRFAQQNAESDRAEADAAGRTETVFVMTFSRFFGTEKVSGRYGHFNIVKREKHETSLWRLPSGGGVMSCPCRSPKRATARSPACGVRREAAGRARTVFPSLMH